MATFCCNPECIKLLQAKTQREKELILEIQSLYTAISGLTKGIGTAPCSAFGAPVDTTKIDTGIPPGPPMESLARPDLWTEDFAFKVSPARQGDFNVVSPTNRACETHRHPEQEHKIVRKLDEAQVKLEECVTSHVAKVEGNSKVENTVTQNSLSPLRGPHPYPYSPSEPEWAPPQCGKQACIELRSGNHVLTCPYRIDTIGNTWAADIASGSVTERPSSTSPVCPPAPHSTPNPTSSPETVPNA
jgi:hypothetical protein